VQQMKSKVGNLTKEQVQQTLQQIEQQAGQAPPDKQKLIELMRKILQARLQSLEGGK